MRYIKIIYILLSVSLLVGCTNTTALIGGTSRKYEHNGGTSNTKQQCRQWCHNGWCSTHCDPVISGS